MANTKIPVELSSTPSIVDNGDATAITIASDEKVGIGTSGPSTNLHIGSGTSGNALGVLLNRGATTNFFEAHDGTKSAYIGTDNSQTFIKVGSLTNHAVQISQNNGAAILIDTSKNATFSGHLTIDNTSADRKLAINRTGGKTFSIEHDTSAFYIYNVTDSSLHTRFTNAGNVSIGSSTANSMRLNVDAGGAHGVFVDDIGTGYDGIQVRGSNTTGTFFGVSFKRSNNTLVGYISVGSSSTDYSESGSDLSLKENIEDWNENVLDKFKDIKPVTFNFISDESKEVKKGYIAQNEVDKFPEAYPINPEDGKYYFASNRMVVYLMKAIQEQQTIIDELKSRIETLEG